MRKVLLIMLLSLFAFRPAAANPVNIVGVGEVELSQDIKVTQTFDKKGAVNYSFIVKDGRLWRAANIMPVKDLSKNNMEMIKLDVMLNRMIAEISENNPDFLEADNAKLLMLKDKECATVSLKMTPPGTGLVANLDMLIIPCSNGYKMFGFMCADSDAQYWRPIMQKIAANIP